jgi:hypothetical protein
MPLASLSNWEITAHDLHKVAQVLGVLRMVRLPHVPNYLEMGLKIKRAGLSTAVLPSGSEVILDFQRANLTIYDHETEPISIALAGQSQVSLLHALLRQLKRTELAELLAYVTEEGLVDSFLAAASAAGHDLSSPHNQITSDTLLQVDQKIAQDYAEALYSIFTGMARFRAALSGPMTPVVVWPGHFDLSFLWFATEHLEESAPHLNFGFAPYGGNIEEPYLYAYAYPLSSAQANDFRMLPKLPFPAHWHTEGWTGVVLPYATIAVADDAEDYVETMCEDIFRVLCTLLSK